ncbi:FAD/NAD-P-binding domain-containing protein [Trametes versicolor FP-101664 SS1]|uniref:FAD/NAD-P-binding domain-containing protein n=1 Tax=Trametes versicolor (strain FP-101664) TaxID=717944 RepID=UPI00046230B0|nr:FAD/NAD-P-binding domain-containing protein [Trametes versicolor FP-101664 SS1]EIW57924.1 FAD/NAD-P-binding domain-containing protein [Trametes versicolor FP-101664 SS1]
MSAESSRSGAPLQTTLPINFLIVGGGVAGLACALALRRVGHHATVVERRDRKSARGEGGIRLPPNLTKIFFHWGLRDALRAKALISHTILFTRYESGEPLGNQVWDQDVLRETRGVFMLLTHAELHDILYDAATRAGARVRFNAEVVSIDPEEREIELTTGETLTGDVIVGADGEQGPSRTAVLGREVRGGPTGLAMYDTIVPGKHLPDHLASLRKDNGVFVAFGEGRAIVAYPVHGTEDFAFQFYGPDENAQGKYGDPPSVSVPEIARPLDPRLADIVNNARTAVRVSVVAHEDLEDWVEDEGRLVLIGDAAHPFAPGTIQATAMAVEDGAVLAKLFSHLSEERQIESFLYAFQELRQPRARSVAAGEFGAAFFMTATGELAAGRDAAMRAQYEAGANALEGEGDEANAAWEEIRTIFGYDCEDEADDWWVQWGLLRERALTRTGDDEDEDGAPGGPPLLDFSAMTVQVSSTATDYDE